MASTRLRALAIAAALTACGTRTELPEPGSGGSAATGDGEVDLEPCGGIDVACGVGACRRTTPACDEGGRPRECVPGSPTEERCNGVDDDCDGAVDEGLPLVLRSGPHTVDPAVLYVGRAQIVPTDEGFLVLYATSFDGSAPEASVFVARLDEHGVPVGPPSVATDRNFTDGPTLSPAPGGWLVAACGRFGFEDLALTGILSASGALAEHGARAPSGHHCGAGAPGAVWTGEAGLVGWTDNGTMEVRLDRLDESGASLGGSVLSEAGDLYSHPRFAATHERVLGSYSARRDGQARLRIHRLDRSGSDVEAPFELAPLLNDAFLDTQLAVATSGDVLLVAHGALGARYQARLDPRGELVGELLVEQAEEAGLVRHTLVSHPSSGFVLAGSVHGAAEYAFVSLLDDRGEERTVWTTLDDPFGEPFIDVSSIAVRGGSLVLTYVSSLSADPSFPELRTLELGCAPADEPP